MIDGLVNSTHATHDPNDSPKSKPRPEILGELTPVVCCTGRGFFG